MRLAIGSNAASVWWVNGKEVIGIYGDRQTVIDDGVSKRLTLKKGPNIVRAAIVNGGGATDFCARFLDADDKPLKGFTVSWLTRNEATGHDRIRARLLASWPRWFGFAQRAPIDAAAHLHAVPRQRHLRRRRNRRLDRDARSGHAHLRLQVDHSAQQCGGSQGRQARSFLGQGQDRNHRRPARDDLRRGRTVRQPDADTARTGGQAPAAAARPVTSEATPAATTDSTRSAPPSRRRRSGSRRRVPTTSTHSGTANSPRRPRSRSTRSSRRSRPMCRASS